MEQGARRRIVQALEEAQRHHQGYLPPSVLRTLAAELGVPSYHLYGLATFFPHFRLEAPTVLATLRAAQLRGMGGAGFSAAIKWEAVRNAPGDEKYVVCNADESEPGTIKDRGILTSVPHLVVEGMAVAGVLTGASRGII